jgi:hypothetical protein
VDDFLSQFCAIDGTHMPIFARLALPADLGPHFVYKRGALVKSDEARWLVSQAQAAGAFHLQHAEEKQALAEVMQATGAETACQVLNETLIPIFEEVPDTDEGQP